MFSLLVESDLHSGNRLGLMPPRWFADEWGELARVMWEWRERELAQIGPVDVHVLNGDLIDGPGRKETIGLVTTDTQEQGEMAVESIKRVRAKKRFVVYGTPFHTVSTYSIESDIAKDLGCKAHDTLRLSVNGTRFNFRHVAGRSDIPYGQGTQIYKEAVRDQLQALAESYEAADVFVRSHVHYYFLTQSSTKTAFTTPCYEIPAGGVYPRTLRTMYYDVGMVLIEVDKSGEVFIRPRLLSLKIVSPKEYVCLGDRSRRAK